MRPLSDDKVALSHLAEKIYNGNKVVFLTGAGLSCASGIPPFRGTRDAVWNKTIHDWGTKDKFLKNPLEWYREFFFKQFPAIQTATPNAGHIAIAKIVENYPNCKVITQNIDMLHSHPSSNIPEENLIEIHGRVKSFRCFTEQCSYSSKLVINVENLLSKEEEIPICPDCSTTCCPNTLLFDEEYSDHETFHFDKALKWLQEADDIVFVGTSFSVGITNFAFEAAQDRETSDFSVGLFDFNIIKSNPRKGTNLMTTWVEGRCEVTLPELNRLIQEKNNSN